MNHYTLDGELWTGCVHMQPIDRTTALRLIRRYGTRSAKRRASAVHGCRWAEFPLRVQSLSLLPKGYTYRQISVGVTP